MIYSLPMNNQPPGRPAAKEAALLNYPAQRRDTEERLAELVSQAKNNPLFKALLRWIDGAVIIVNKGRQIVMASQEFVDLAEADNLDDLLGKRIGEALGCVHVKEGSDGCSTASACNYCGALRALARSRTTDELIESECRLFLKNNLHPQSIKMAVRAIRTNQRDYDFSVLAFTRAKAPIGIFDDENTLLEMPSSSTPAGFICIHTQAGGRGNGKCLFGPRSTR